MTTPAPSSRASSPRLVKTFTRSGFDSGGDSGPETVRAGGGGTPTGGAATGAGVFGVHPASHADASSRMVPTRTAEGRRMVAPFIIGRCPGGGRPTRRDRGRAHL